jgi:protocatechuate 3,4-dioxygenase beta subunit
MQRISFLFISSVILSLGSCSQNNAKTSAKDKKDQTEIKVGGSCEGCEAIYECPVSFDQLNNIDTLPDFNDPGPKIEISGIVYNRDGKTPAKDVVIYIYHTDQKGIYATKGNEKGWAKRHGYIRGWVKTDKNGFYQFYTLRPAAYPERQNPQHIHVTVKEPGKSEYWIDEYLFADDPLLKKEEHNRPPRGGNGIIELKPQQNGISHATRNIILGENVPDYPSK